ncbi:MAG: hypothetical protein QXL15_00965, partial [Candidatus Korarchaeota archaeon]
MELKIATASADSVKITKKEPPFHAVPVGTEIALFENKDLNLLESNVYKISGFRFSIRAIKYLGGKILVGGKEGIVMAYDENTKNSEYTIPVNDVILTIDEKSGKLFIGAESSISVYDYTTRKRIVSLDKESLLTENEHIIGAAFSDDGNYIA